MKRLLFVTSYLSIYLGSVLSQETQSPGGEVLDDVVIKTSVEVNYKEEKPPIHLQLDFSKAATLEDLFQWQEESDWLPQPPTLNEGLDLRLSTEGAAGIFPSPVKVFRVKFKALREWHLIVLASNGRVFRKLSGSGSPPAEIKWDGLSDSGQPILPGVHYLYDFTAIDKAGNKRSFPGKPFSVSSYHLYKNGKLVVGLAKTELLAPDGFHLLPRAHQLAEEVAALVRFFAHEGTISVQTTNSNLEPFVGLVATELAVDRAFLKNGSEPQAGDGIMFLVQ